VKGGEKIMLKTNKRGFTLIELLVVIAIIGLLATIVLVSLNNARNKANNAKIKSDLSQMMLAVEMFYSDAVPAAYPVALSNLTPTYIHTLPTCPGGCTYTYTGGATYSISAPLFAPLSGTWTCEGGSCHP
jgi:prepilin-type N-terminal cleavage/methylation domain-containing protein